jgi:hypothetical protein
MFYVEHHYEKVFYTRREAETYAFSLGPIHGVYPRVIPL